MAAHRSIVLLMLLGMAGTPNAARAEEGSKEAEPTHARTAQILEELDRPEPGKGWLSVHLDRIRVNKKYGLAYTRRMEGGEKGMEFTLRGPALGRKKRVGLSFEIRF